MNGGAERGGEPPRWYWRNLLIAPHRLAFFLAMWVLGAGASWWAAVQLDRIGFGPGLNYVVSPSLVHAALMTFGFMPLFFSGFLFTAGPKWLVVRGPSPFDVAPALLAQCAGWLVWLVGSHLHPVLATGGLALAAIGLVLVTGRFLRLVAASREADRVHAKMVAAAFVTGCVSLTALAMSLLAGSSALARAFVLTGLWAFVVVVFVTVAHRMIPFFTSSAVPLAGAWGSFGILWLMVGAALLEALAAWIDTLAGGDATWQLARGLLELGAGGVLVWLAVTWGLVQSLKIRLLAMLHLGFLWLGLALALGGAAQLLEWATGTPFLPLAALHALTMGCLGSLMLAMVTRVTCGHSGRRSPVVADDLVWIMFLLLQVATLLRIAAAVPAWPGQVLLTAAALVWACAMITWGGRYGAWYGRPSTDPLRR
jgi:uncharacterized protein involved in response to NO